METVLYACTEENVNDEIPKADDDDDEGGGLVGSDRSSARLGWITAPSTHGATPQEFTHDAAKQPTRRRVYVYGC